MGKVRMGGKQEKSGIGEGGRAATSVGCAPIKLGKEVESMAAACTVLPLFPRSFWISLDLTGTN